VDAAEAADAATTITDARGNTTDRQGEPAQQSAEDQAEQS
jgi:hypothetical protein